jgi:hypothetical protein
MVLIHHLKSAKYLQPSYPSLGYMSWRGNTAPIFLVVLISYSANSSVYAWLGTQLS